MNEQIIFAGFGGQGVLSMGKILAQSAMQQGKHVTWLPEYGPEMRGGTANCNVIISDKLIGAPVVSCATSVIAMNTPSLEKFEKSCKKNGNLFINSSIVSNKAKREDISAYYIPANEIAQQLGNEKVANIVMLGAYIEKTNAISIQALIQGLKNEFGERKAHLIQINQQALELGAKALKKAL